MTEHSTIWFALGCAILLYAIAGYPLLLKILARFWRKPVRKGEFLPSVAMVIPVRNAEAYLRRKLDSVLALDYPQHLLEVLVISDGSTDETDAIARSYAAWDVRLLHVPYGGKAAALNAGIPATRSEILILSDVWQILETKSVREIVKCFADPAVGVVSGEVVMHGRGGAQERNLSMFAQFESWFGDRLSDVDSMLGSGGPFYAIRRALMPRIPGDVLLDDLFVAMSAFFRGFRVVVEPGATAYDDAAPIDTEFGEKIKAQAGDYQMMNKYPGLLTSLNRMRFHYFSYKVARLLLPFALICIAVSSFGLPTRREMIWALAVQGVFYLLAIADGWLGDSSFLKRLSAAAHTFVVTALASLCAIAVLFVPVEKLWPNKDQG